MPKQSETTYEEYEQDSGKNAPYRSARREIRRPKGRGRQRRLSVHAVPRKEPDYRKLARAVIQIALPEAEAEAAAAATLTEPDSTVDTSAAPPATEISDDA